MPRDERWASVNLDAGGAPEASPPIPSDDTSFRILLLGDFSGRGTRGLADGGGTLARRVPLRVDRDDFDDVLARIAPEIALAAPGDREVIRIRELDDFHPDRLFDELATFQRLRDLRARVASPATFAAAAHELLGGSGGSQVAGSGAPRPAPGHVLDAILGEPLGEPAAAPPEDDLQAMIRTIVAPHLVPTPDPRQGELLAQLDAAIADRLRSVLHDRAFQSVESLWRALWLLVRRVDTSESLQVHVLDLSARELVGDLSAASPEASALWKIIVDGSVGTPGAPPWSLIVGAYTFGYDDADLALVPALGAIARRAGAPFIAGAAPRLAGAPGFDRVPDAAEWSRDPIAAWDAARRDPNARYVGLVAPRFLARAPYGADTDPCDRIRFEELTGAAAHGDYLWANGAFAVALLLAESFADAGWTMRAGMHREIGGLPYVVIRRTGSSHAQPCAEILLTERGAHRLMDAGVMPLASLKDRDAVLLVRFQSVAAPLAALAGRWATGEGVS